MASKCRQAVKITNVAMETKSLGRDSVIFYSTRPVKYASSIPQHFKETNKYRVNTEK